MRLTPLPTDISFHQKLPYAMIPLDTDSIRTNNKCWRGSRLFLYVIFAVTTTLSCTPDGCYGFVYTSRTTMRKTPNLTINEAASINVMVTVKSLFDSSAARTWQQRGTSLVVASWSPLFGNTKSAIVQSALYGMWSQDDEIEGADRIKACIPYLLPLIDGDHFGQYMYERIAFLGTIDEVTIGPLAEWGHKIPFLSLGLFIALTLGTRFNSSMSRNLRFSAQQAALIDVALLFPELIGSGFAEDPVPRYIAEPCCNFVWYAYTSVVLYCIISNIRGKKPDQIPYLSNSADIMVGPF
jgi:Chloroplast import apparatus Tic20-like